MIFSNEKLREILRLRRIQLAKEYFDDKKVCDANFFDTWGAILLKNEVGEIEIIDDTENAIERLRREFNNRIERDFSALR